ncbi:PHP domain-containing protein [Lutibacter sp. B2]|nr:PHP domain-containing protein [Lutibacter sp. B2]
MYGIDMHVHTNLSDGIFLPSEIVDWAVKLGLKGIAITDHDIVDGIELAFERAKKYEDFIVVPGIEFSTIYKKKEVHILGYFIDYKNEEMLDICKKIQLDRQDRAKKMVQNLQRVGLNIKLEEVEDACKKGSVGRPHIARILIANGYASCMEEAFVKWLKKGKPGYVERFKFTIEDAIYYIEKAGGIPVLAHPGLIDKQIDILNIIRKGIKGIEVYHTKHSDLDSENYLKLANEKKLFITGGSDYHDRMFKGIPTLGSVNIPYDRVIAMKK